MDSRLLEALDAGHVVLTAHRRQARQLRYRYAAHQRAAGVDAWETPEVHGWDDWLRRINAEITWSGYAGPRHQRKLLSPVQEHVLWEHVVRESHGDLLDDLAGAARKARAAWRLIQEYRLPDPASATFANDDVRAFSRWMRAYHGHCSRRALLDQARLADTIGPALRAGAVAMPEQIQLAGFDEFAPQQRDLLKVLEDLGTRLGQVRGPRLDGDARRLRFPDARAEYAAAAHWVRAALEQQPDGHYAVLVPELARDRKIVERVFDEILLPGSTLPTAGAGGRPYNLSVGSAFERHPLVAAALSMCAFGARVIEFATLSSVLRSPFSRAAVAEHAVRSRFEMYLRRRNLTEVGGEALPEFLRRFCARARTRDNLLLETVLTSLRPLQGRCRAEARPSYWASLFKQMLDVWGWPGETPLSSAEFQTVERFRSMLEELAGLDALTAPTRFGGALALLRRLCTEVAFQPQTPELAVEILLPEQAYGLQFERVWACGWHAEAWPRSPQPNPFVPIEWQRQYEIPRGTPEAELRYATRLTRRLLQAAPVVVLSSPASVEDRPVAVSPLLAVVPPGRAEPAATPGDDDYALLVRRSGRCEHYTDERGPALEGFERVGGGSRLFTLQSQCPFRAFAELRLGAVELPEPAPGLDPMLRGILVHRALEGIWRRLDSHDVLERVLDSEHLSVLIREAAEDTLEGAEQRGIARLGPRFRHMELERLQRLVRAWLEHEVRRAPFRIAYLEEDRPLQIGPLEIRARADRTDRLADGRIVIIDYKTGQPGLADMLGERPAEPQLPLYAIAEEGEVAAVLFARVRANDEGFVGVARSDDLVPGVRGFDGSRPAVQRGLDWDGLFALWREALTSLAEEYAAGVARVDPQPNACSRCHLAALCRIAETRQAGAGR